MVNKTLVCLLLLFLALGAASVSAASETSFPASPQGDLPTGIDPATDQLLLATHGGKVNWSCIGAIAGVTAFGLVAGAASGGAGLALAGAYAPIAVVLCT